jgi:hypothetical protein
MLMQERVSGPEVVLKLFVTIDDRRKHLRPYLATKPLPCDPRGSQSLLSASAVLTMMIGGAGRGMTDQAKLDYSMREPHGSECPPLGSYSTFVDATHRDSPALRGLLAFLRAHNRHAPQPYPMVFQDSTARPVCTVARASQHQTFGHWARQSQTGRGGGDGVKLPAPCAEEGRLCAFALSTAAVDDRHLLSPLTQWMTTGVVVGDRGSISEAIAGERGVRGLYGITALRKTRRNLPSQCQLPCLHARHRIEELCEFLKGAFGLGRSTPRAASALPIHLLVCLAASSLYKQLFA